jgi:hypothetical protein
MATKNPNVKKGTSELSLTYDQIREFRKCATDPIYFIENYIYIRHPVKGQTKFVLYDYQRELILAYHNNKEVITLFPRQSGKCFDATTTLTTFHTSRINIVKRFILKLLFNREYQQLCQSLNHNEDTTPTSNSAPTK